jgi:hypothetical protein
VHHGTVADWEDVRRIALQLLDEISVDDLRETIVEAWLARAPKRLVDRYLSEG